MVSTNDLFLLFLFRFCFIDTHTLASSSDNIVRRFANESQETMSDESNESDPEEEEQNSDEENVANSDAVVSPHRADRLDPGPTMGSPALPTGRVQMDNPRPAGQVRGGRGFRRVSVRVRGGQGRDTGRVQGRQGLQASLRGVQGHVAAGRIRVRGQGRPARRGVQGHVAGRGRGQGQPARRGVQGRVPGRGRGRQAGVRPVAPNLPNITWTKTERHTPNVHPFNEAPGLKPAIVQTLPADRNQHRPTHYAGLYLTDQILNGIVVETNRYATQLIAEKEQNGTLKDKSRLQNWKPVTLDELKKFLALVLLTGLVRKRSYAEYWSTDILLNTPVFGYVMPRDRFQVIKRCLHFNDNLQDGYDPNAANRDRLHKLRPIIDGFNERCRDVYTPDRYITIDESLILWRGRLLFRQSIRSKRARVGVKLYPLCTHDGITLAFRVYSAEDIPFQDDTWQYNFSKTEQLTLNLVEPYLDLGYHLYTDNFYTSPHLAKYLFTRSTHLCGTVRPNRKGLPTLELANEDLQKGEMVHYESDDRNMMVVKYREASDRASGQPKVVHMLSTIHDTSKKNTGRQTRGDNTPIIKPSCVFDYNKFMGGVDLTDQALGLGSLCPMRKTLKWYQKIFIRLLLQMILNAHKVYKKHLNAAASKHTLRYLSWN